ncbi:L-ribulose-5-phosphate 4-epimerase AraD [Mesorhizobium sp.]|uniref:L-ribulose-5-phosphate 4-epimerase AraD n=1 Tax=Mesorhizobium sp. TaxID=1871066 RepID=UPI000FEA6EB2|nr:L-ribulose-5-phosphate 4-epimerase AraD [Mesorhizobium sp.]RWG04168.1 MAG: L-ribulose-5-phosphate 4-epimerase AraD [Mesorhizobium sp.]RWH01165.1 MAG: L-ribulose-5-phosphate 4-epimerase AraD [Mesorhizobium sp.]RWI16619.1 MAG: L-ribulose-5-phosphate 4-epimerase AraD [Mesorhizobium sp.]RWN07687.1 MAG: L-ribulose-5-phosphate 4-epimerase AraD [Mesorhizobium sp.]RWN12395.1 MAG: L-ribulose-5-phosphate 4-epimerase AraD [Mesorhizobium sp.]
MKHPELRKAVLDANFELYESGLVISTFGNVSAIDRTQGLVAIKPSGVSYNAMNAGDIVVTDLDGNIVDGDLRPSSDIDTHLELYKQFRSIGAVVHTHSYFATAWAQSGQPIPAMGTTHADYFNGAIPVTRHLTESEILTDYVRNTGRVIVEALGNNDPMSIPAALVNDHGPFCWGIDAPDAVHNAAMLEAVARIAFHSRQISDENPEISSALLTRHFLRKHGHGATYGQPVRNKRI